MPSTWATAPCRRSRSRTAAWARSGGSRRRPARGPSRPSATRCPRRGWLRRCGSTRAPSRRGSERRASGGRGRAGSSRRWRTARSGSSSGSTWRPRTRGSTRRGRSPAGRPAPGAGGSVVGGGRPARRRGPLVPGADRRFGVGRPARGAVPGRVAVRLGTGGPPRRAGGASSGYWLLPETSVVSPRPVRGQRAERPGRRARRLRLRQQRALRPGVGGGLRAVEYATTERPEHAGVDVIRARALYDAYRDGGGPARLRDEADFTMIIAVLGHITQIASRRWLATTEPSERDDLAAWAAELTDRPLTRQVIHQLLQACVSRPARVAERGRVSYPVVCADRLCGLRIGIRPVMRLPSTSSVRLVHFSTGAGPVGIVAPTRPMLARCFPSPPLQAVVDQQCGVVTRRQLRDHGVSIGQIRWQLGRSGVSCCPVSSCSTRRCRRLISGRSALRRATVVAGRSHRSGCAGLPA